MRIWNSVSFALLVGVMCAPLMAQNATALGVVTDDSGAAVPGATVTFTNIQTGQIRSTETDSAGSYRLPALNVGNYEARVTKEGFGATALPGITLTVSQEATINVTLKVGAVNQEVTVAGTVQTVNTDSATLGGLVDEQRVADLPLNGRNLVQLSLQEIGVVSNTSYSFTAGFTGVMINANGASVRSNNWLLDGGPTQNFYGANNSSISGTNLGVEGTQEFRIITSGIGAEYGGTMGAQVVMVSKGGSNQVHGSAFDYLRNSDLDARNFFDPHVIPAFERNNFGGSLGGPIKKDKTFIFGVYEGLKSRTGLTEVDNVMAPGCHGAGGAVITNVACPQLGSVASTTVSPTIASILALFPLPNLPNNEYAYGFNEPNSESYGQVRVDQNFSTKDTLFGRFTMDNDNQTAPEAYPGFKIIEFSRNQYITGGETHIFSPTLLNTLRFSYMETLLSTASPTGLSGPNYAFVPGQEMGGVSIGGVTTMTAEGSSPAHFNQYLENYSDDLFYTKGRHSLKFGALMTRYDDPFLNNTSLRGSVTFANVASFLAATTTDYTEATPVGTKVTINGVSGVESHDRDFHYTTMGFYAQDDFKVTSRLTLNLGLRYEPGTVPTEVNGKTAALRNPLTDP
ncbi:MAG: carboxypeptidase regulatory-like domain-containing protein, partial [Bryobacteraceae bacterium]